MPATTWSPNSQIFGGFKIYNAVGSLCSPVAFLFSCLILLLVLVLRAAPTVSLSEPWASTNLPISNGIAIGGASWPFFLAYLLVRNS